MLLGLRWQRVVGPLVSFQRLADHFYDECPAGYSVTLTGAVVRNTEDGPMLEVSNGQVVTVGFEDALFSEEDHDEPGDDDVDGSADRNRLSPSDTTNDQAAGDTVPAVEEGLPESTDHPVLIVFGVLAVNQTPETVDDLSLPATVNQALAAVQAARRSDPGTTFPVLLHTLDV
eukprot:s9938_g1.t1